MSFWDDERAQAIQIGAVLLFAVLVIAFSLYQAFVVPNQNEQIEMDHSVEVQSQLQDLRNAIVSMPGRASSTGTTISLGTSYPARIIALNPAPPSGRLSTDRTTDSRVNLTITNATATGETGDVWNGSTRAYNTGGIVYEPNYNRYRNPPTTIYENTVLYNSFGERNLTLAGQSLISGDRISLVTLNGSFSRSSSVSTTVDTRPISSSEQTVLVSGDAITLNLTTRLSVSRWETLLDGEENVDTVTPAPNADAVPEPFTRVQITLDSGQYRLQMTKVGVGTGTREESAEYLTDIEGDGSTMQEKSNQTLVVQARDQFNNPVSGENVTASVENGTLANTTAETDENGRASFTYTSADISEKSSQQEQVNVTLTDEVGASFDSSGPKNVSMTVTVQNTDGSGLGGDSGGGAYAVDWMGGQGGIDCPNGPDQVCTFDASESLTGILTMGTDPIAQEATVEYALNDTSIVSLSRTTGTTNANGENATTAIALDDGFVNVYTSSGSSGDTLVLEVINTVAGLIYNDDAGALDGDDEQSPDKEGGVEFSVTNEYNSDVTIDSITVDPVNDNIVELSDNLADEPEPDNVDNVEVYIATDTDAYTDYDEDVTIPDNGLTVNVGEDGTSNSGNKAVINVGNSATISFYEFYSAPGTSENFKNHDMNREQLNITITYTVGEIQATEEFTLTA